MSDDVITTVTGIVAGEFGLPAAGISPDVDLSSLEGADSVKVLRAVAKIERTYDIELEDDQVFGLKSVRDAATLVVATLAEKEPSGGGR
ncbi:MULTISPECIES: acyl carrier protein [Actinokineospora]|uniref:Acyl carrier protein n=2 Tax=Actinokineospora TaxID=39845 RepID=A0A421B1J0_9PSEU|nr:MULTISPECIES: acyl carrier protein [Actinokineospora]RLK58143.1 acyl carrier protein [Actinokineospora cianjurensis]SES49281.1 acyl carrier protein [Actinokineospora terrae]